jgi:HAD superfamily hydrolase (TIGR01549 family)
VARSPSSASALAAILDVDGTLVDSVYHHALAWHRAFRRCEVDLPVWRIHRHIGMGGDKLVSALCGERFDAERGDDVREAEADCFEPLQEEVRPLAGARELMEELRRRGRRIVLASSAKEHELEHYVDLLDARELADGWTSSADVDATKPDPDILRTALDRVGGGEGVVVGDSTWDCRAAVRTDLPVIGMLTGGFGEAELRDAGAVEIFESLDALRDGLDATALAG